MGRIKDLVAKNEVVRLFGVGQVFHPKIIEMIGLHGGFDGLWLDAEHAVLDTKDVELATLAARLTASTISSARPRPITRRSCVRSKPAPAA